MKRIITLLAVILSMTFTATTAAYAQSASSFYDLGDREFRFDFQLPSED